MITEIRYSSQSAVPSGYDTPDGTLDLSLNMLPQHPGSSVEPLPNPAPLFRIPEGTKVLTIHIVAGKQYVLLCGYELYDSSKKYAVYWDEFNEGLGEKEIDELHLLFSCNSIPSQTVSCGNIVIFNFENQISYAIWRGGGYYFLGARPPFVPLKFSVQPAASGEDASVQVNGVYLREWEGITSQIKVTQIEGPDKGKTVDQWWAHTTSESEVKSFSDTVIGCVNKAIVDARQNGKFAMPFLVRYAVRLIGGYYVNFSSPVLMYLPQRVAAPVQCCVSEIKDSKVTVKCRPQVAMFLQMEVLDAKWKKDISLWDEIIEAVDIFVSAPIYTYNQSGEYSVYGVNLESPSLNDLKISNDKWYDIPLPPLEVPLSSQVVQTANFYKVASYKLSSLKKQIGKDRIKLLNDNIEGLLTFETMPDEFRSMSVKSASSVFPFNGRINLANKDTYPNPPLPFPLIVSELLSPDPDIILSHEVESSVSLYCEPDAVGCVSAPDYEADGYSSDCDKLGAAFWRGGSSEPLFQWPLFIFINEPSAKWLHVKYNFKDGSKEVITSRWFELNSHDFLNGAYWIHPDFDNLVKSVNPSSDFVDVVPPDEVVNCSRLSVPQPNKLLTSSVNNPFHFPVENINSVGTGQILGISSAAKALSQGQFGQFPLYAFTSEGVWAMEVSATGTYSARQPITRDVCINPDGITQIDSAVLFPTDRGIMLISGSETRCISDTINTDTPFDFFSLPGAQSLHSLLGSPGEQTLKLIPFTEFLRTCRMVYDYTHQRIIVYSPCESAITPPWENEDNGAGESQQPSGFRYAYVFSLQTNAWGMMQTRIATDIDSYPRALAVDTDNTILDFCQEDKEILFYPGIIVSRPLKLGAPDVLKTIDTVIQRGNFAPGHVQSVLYGSRDLIHWYLVWSSKNHYLRGFRGTPYKYFRIALLCNLGQGESISGCSVQHELRLTNQPR